MTIVSLEIDPEILKNLREIQEAEERPLDQIVSDLLAEAIQQRASSRPARRELKWISRPLGARFDLTDKEAIYSVQERLSPRSWATRSTSTFSSTSPIRVARSTHGHHLLQGRWPDRE